MALVLALQGCYYSWGYDDPPDPDAGTVPAPVTCESWQEFPPDCYSSDLDCTCSNESVCKVWGDILAYQCRVRFECTCEEAR